MVRSTILAAAVLLGSALNTHAQIPGAGAARTTAVVQPAAVTRGGKGMLLVTVIVTPRYHINAHKPNNPDLIPTVFQGKSAKGVKFGAPVYPAAKALKVTYDKKPLLVYSGKAIIKVPFTVAKNAKSGPIALDGEIRYQACDDNSCFPPSSAPFRTKVTVK